MKSNNEIKISFTGDIMCEKPLLKASRLKNGEYDFSKVFLPVKKCFSQSEYVVGNLETVFAGEERKYTNHIYNFNTPDQFLNAIKNSGFDMVTTANNHCLDRGVVGLNRTISLLDMHKIDHTGTNSSQEDREKIFVKKIKGTKISFLSYTYGTNTQINNFVLNEKNKHSVNLLQPQTVKVYDNEKQGGYKKLLLNLVFKIISIEQWMKIKKAFNLPYNHSRTDDNLDNINNAYLELIEQDIKKARDQSDYVIMCMHSGGQFNSEPGKFSKFMMRFMKDKGVDAVIGNHPHVVQRCEVFSSGMFGAYSLGNFCISPSSVYVLHENLPEYSIILHLYLKKESTKLKTKKITFSILKIVEDKKHSLTVYPLADLIKHINSEIDQKKLIADATTIYNRFLSKNVRQIDICDEYTI